MKISVKFNWLILVLLFMAAFICKSGLSVVALWVYVIYSVTHSDSIWSDKKFYIRVIFLCLVLGINTYAYIEQYEYNRTFITDEDIEDANNIVQQQTSNKILRVIVKWATEDREINENIVAYAKYVSTARNMEFVEIPREYLHTIQYLERIEELQYRFLHSREFIDVAAEDTEMGLLEEDSKLYRDILRYTILSWFMNECVAAILYVLAVYLYFTKKGKPIECEVPEYSSEVVTDTAFNRLFGGFKENEL